ncbi:MAG: GMC oxidoreductase [Actinomycetota bacterium]
MADSDGPTIGSVADPEAVCVIGSGPVGLALSLRLAGVGRSVVLVDSGRFAADGQDPGLTGGRVTRAADAPDRTDPTLIAAGSLYQYLRSDYLVASRYLGSGGAANRWLVKGRPDGEHHVRLAGADPADFDARPDLDIPAWATPAGDVLDRSAPALDFFDLPDDAFETPTGQPPTDAIDLDPALLRRRLFRFARADVVHRVRLAEAAAHPGIRMLSGQHLVRIAADRGEQVRSVDTVDGRNLVTTIEAGCYVLALGGIENTRQLLLAAEEGQLADPNDVLGRWFCDHPHGRLGFVDLDPINAAGIAETYDFVECGDTPALRGFELTPAAAREHELLRFSIELAGRPAAFRTRGMTALARTADGVQARSVREVVTALPGLARSPVGAFPLAVAAARGRVHGPHLGGWSDPATRLHDVETVAVEAMFEQRPSPDNRIRLGPDRDRFGRRLPVLQWSWSSKEVASINRSADLVAEAFAEVGAGSFVTMRSLGQGDIPRAGSGWHHMGGTRQSDDPADGVVDASNRVHGVANLYVAGSSVFPNSVGYANPTLTAVADAIRLADLLAADPAP